MTRCASLLAALLCAAHAHAGPPVPAELAGIWATDESVLRGDVLQSGDALYVDVDGIGAAVSGTAAAVLGVRLDFAAYDAEGHVLRYTVRDGSRTVAGGELRYDPAERVLISPADHGRRYRRRQEALGAATRAGLGLPPRAAAE